MTSPRRIAGPNAKNRAVLLDAAEQLMLEEGYTAVSSRRVAAAAGLKPQLVHYFRTMDDLFLEVFRRRADEGLARLTEALSSPRPLRTLWEHATDPRGTALTMEFAALANHRKAIGVEIAHYAERFQHLQAEGLAKALEQHGTGPEPIPPIVLPVLLTSVSVVLAMEQALGMSAGHAETITVVERYLRELEPQPAARSDSHSSRPTGRARRA